VFVGDTQTALVLPTAFLAASVIATSRSVFSPQRINYFHFAVLVQGVFLGCGPWIAYYYGGKEALAFIPTDLLPNTYLVIGLYALGIWIVGAVFAPWKPRAPGLGLRQDRFSVTKAFQQYWMVERRIVVIFVAGVWLVRLTKGIKFGVWYSGAGKGEFDLDLPYYTTALSHWAILAALGCLVWGSAAFWSDKSSLVKYTGGALLAGECGWAFMSGRRHVLVWLACFLLGYLASGRRLHPRYVLLFLLLLVLTATLVFPFYNSVRRAYAIERAETQHDGNDLGRYARAVVLAFEEDEDTRRYKYREDMGHRVFGIQFFFFIICEALQSRPPMMGRASLAGIGMIIPAAVLPSDYSKLSPEMCIVEDLDLWQTDYAICWQAAGCADFGIAGGAVAGILVGVWIVVIVRWSQLVQKRHPLVSLCLVGASISCLVQIEAGITQFWLVFRDVSFILLIAELLRVLRAPPSQQRSLGHAAPGNPSDLSTPGLQLHG